MKTKILIHYFVMTLLVITLIISGCAKSNKKVTSDGLVDGKGQAKYVFLFVGDGMSTSQFTATEYYLATKDNITNYDINRLSFTQFPVAGIMNTHDSGSLITDSASAGTAFGAGRKTLSSMINVNPKNPSEEYKTIAEYAQEAGMRIGIVSTVTLTHATPASFYGKVSNRNNTEGDTNNPRGLSQQLVESGFDYFAGGWIVSNNANNDKWLDEARRLGYTVTRTSAAFNTLNKNSGKVIALAERVQDSGAMHYEIDRLRGVAARNATDISLADFTRKGIELLENPKGFFMMVEAGKIDWAGHANDAGAVIHDVLALDDAVKVALDFYNRHPTETLIVMIGDHETGGMSIGWAGTAGIPAQSGVSANLGMGYSMYFDRIAKQTRSYVAFDEEIINPYREKTPAANRRIEDLYSDILTSFGIDLRPESLNVSEYQRNQIELAFKRSMAGDPDTVPVPQEGWRVFNAGYEPLSVKLTQIMNQNSGIGWTSYSHTAVPVANFAFGVHQEIFGGYYDNTDIFFKLASAMNLKVN